MDKTQQLPLIVQPLLDWFDTHQRILPWREDPTPYHVWISEIMLQQTRVSAVISYYNRFLRELPDMKALAQVPDDELMKLWQGLGYYSRARNLKKTAGICARDYGGQLPADYKKLLKLPGIGPYTAGAIASIAFGIARPAVDGNVLRVISRILADRRDIADPAVKKDMEAMLQALMDEDFQEEHPAGECSEETQTGSGKSDCVAGTQAGSGRSNQEAGTQAGSGKSNRAAGIRLRDVPGLFNQALMELGALICLPNGEPYCAECPVCEICLAHQLEVTDQIPYKAPKKARKIEKKTVLIIEKIEQAEKTAEADLEPEGLGLEAEGLHLEPEALHLKTVGPHLKPDGRGQDSRKNGMKIALRKRPEEGLLAGLYEFPALEGHLSDRQIESYLSDMGQVEFIEAGPDSRHIFTHIEWHMKAYHVGLSQVWEDAMQFYTLDQIRGELAVPSAYAAYLKYIAGL